MKYSTTNTASFGMIPIHSGLFRHYSELLWIIPNYSVIITYYTHVIRNLGRIIQNDAVVIRDIFIFFRKYYAFTLIHSKKSLIIWHD